LIHAFIAILLASLLSRLGYQMARSPVLPTFAADLGALPELIGIIVAASTITGVVFKLPAGALSDVLGRKRMMVLGARFFARSEEDGKARGLIATEQIDPDSFQRKTA
jgi:MFS transporter, DHA1 family, multidrug resistance protein